MHSLTASPQLLHSGQTLTVTLDSGQHRCYRLDQCLAQGGGRQTWRAVDLQPQPQPVILKLLAFQDGLLWKQYELFEREVRLLQFLDHPRLPRFRHSFRLANGWIGLAQDYIPGASLKQQLQAGHRFDEGEIRRIAQEVLEILSEVHRFSPPILHRDIKPSNLIWGEEGELYLIDWGAAQEQAALPGKSFTVVGSYGYAPLEQFGGRAVPASDLYGLGMTLIHLLCGTAPADLPQVNLRTQFLAVPGGIERDRLSPDLARWLERMTHPQVEQRFATATAAQAALAQAELAQARGSGLIARSYSAASLAGLSAASTAAAPTAAASTAAASTTQTQACGVQIRRSPGGLLVELPGSEAGSVILGLSGVFVLVSLLLNPLFLLLALLLGSVGLWLSARRLLQLDRQGGDRLRLRLSKKIGGRSLLHRQERSARIQQVFHRSLPVEPRLDWHRSDRTLVIQTARRRYLLSCLMTRAESAWLQQEIHQWLAADTLSQ